MIDEKKLDRLDDKELKAKEATDKKEVKDKKEDKSLSEDEKKVADKAADKKISKEEAKKEVAREDVKKETGYSAESMAEVGKTVLHANESIKRPDDPQKTAGKMAQVKGNAVEGMLEKMVDPKVAQKIVQAGLGSEFTSTGASGLEQGARTVLEESKKFGGEKGMEKMLADAALQGVLTLEEIKRLTPAKLKETVDRLKTENNAPHTVQKGREPFAGKGGQKVLAQTPKPRIPDGTELKPNTPKEERHIISIWRDKTESR